MKFVAMQAVENDVAVAPFAGAWIEIFVAGASFSHALVAPFAGAWIEIKLALEQIYQDNVAPFAGAWIEIPNLIPVTASK